tara:strand:- start:4411 stop:4875 length:465 start_codon:yes stop_codon:yes gene_type:complete
MDKILKLFLLFFLFSSSYAKDEILKPNNKIKPDEVIKIQLKGLMQNDIPYKDSGIEQTWEFAHPNNQKFTGPIERFKEMIKGESYDMLLNHLSHEVSKIYANENTALYEVIVLDANKQFFKFRWQVEKFLKSGPLKNCWLTTVVSQPIPLGSST